MDEQVSDTVWLSFLFI